MCKYILVLAEGLEITAGGINFSFIYWMQSPLAQPHQCFVNPQTHVCEDKKKPDTSIPASLLFFSLTLLKYT